MNRLIDTAVQEQLRMDVAEMREVAYADKLSRDAEAERPPVDSLLHRIGRAARGAGELLVRFGNQLDRQTNVVERL